MRINSINSNQNFGRLKITGAKEFEGSAGSGKECRNKMLANAPSEKFDEIDKLSGNTPVEIKFYCIFSIMKGTYDTCVETYINKKEFIDLEPVSSYEELDKKVLSKIKKHFAPNAKTNTSTARKYFA